MYLLRERDTKIRELSDRVEALERRRSPRTTSSIVRWSAPWFSKAR